MVKRHQVSDVLDFLGTLPQNTRVQLYTLLPTKYGDRTLATELDLLQKKGFTRLILDGETVYIEELLEAKTDPRLDRKLDTLKEEKIQILIDRFVIKPDDEENAKRIADSVQTAFYESEGEAIVAPESFAEAHFNTRYELDGMEFLEPTPQLFNFNNPYGACPRCEGFGRVMGIDETKVIPNQSLSIYEDAIAPWKTEGGTPFKTKLVRHAEKHGINVHAPYGELSREARRILWKGTRDFDGITQYFDALEAKTYKIQNRVLLARYRGKSTCPNCDGGRLRTEASYVRIAERGIMDLVDLPIDELRDWFGGLTFEEQDQQIARRLLLEISSRIQFMLAVGLSYLTINRVSSTLSGGETQRINLTRMLGSNLTSSMYILDEPSIGSAPAGHESPRESPAAPARPRQHRGRRRARGGHHRGGGLPGRHRSGGRRARRGSSFCGRLQRHPPGRPGKSYDEVHDRRDAGAATGVPPPAAEVAPAHGCNHAQCGQRRCPLPAGSDDGGDGGEWLRQDDARQVDPLPGAQGATRRGAHRSGRLVARAQGRRTAHHAGGFGQPKPYRQILALQPRDLRQGLRRHPQPDGRAAARRACGASSRGTSVSTSTAAGATPARARASRSSRCSSWPTCGSSARPAAGSGSRKRSWRSPTATRASTTCST